MTVDMAVELGRAAVMMTLLLGMPVMVVAIIVGLVISILQAMTQIQDQTLSFVPKIVAMILTILYLLPWTMERMIEYSTELIHGIPMNL
jgi:flagellar biosynthesis protein FliQ